MSERSRWSIPCLTCANGWRTSHASRSRWSRDNARRPSSWRRRKLSKTPSGMNRAAKRHAGSSSRAESGGHSRRWRKGSNQGPRSYGAAVEALESASGPSAGRNVLSPCLVQRYSQTSFFSCSAVRQGNELWFIRESSHLFLESLTPLRQGHCHQGPHRGHRCKSTRQIDHPE
jgi:hypothetical protein